MSKKNLIAIVILFVVLLGAIFVTLYLISSNQDTRSSANTPDDLFPIITDIPVPVEIQDGESTDPGPVDNVSVNYPNIEGDQADFTKASCTWDSNMNAFQYNLKITEVDTGTVLTEEVVNSGMQKDVFDVIPNNTYRCEVAAINSAGVAGTAGVDEQVCEVEASASPTPIVTVAPTEPPASPTATLVPQIPTAKPTLPPAGSVGTIATIGLGGVLLFLIGGALLFL
ncbi:MAG TPA: hypothetical protein PLD54_04655 [Candidatus Levybacteria bacterium]|nr:hypothetical protein [Candidatus Levybacteria bacterium]